MERRTPRNEEGQLPTRTPDETVDRLQEKKKDAGGRANKERIEEQEREVTRER